MNFNRRVTGLFAALCALGSVSLDAAETLPASEGPLITLEQAYDLALASDQSIRIAFLELGKARLLPWSALTKLGPQLTASGGYSRQEQALTSGSSAVDPTIGSSSGSGNRTSHTRDGSATAGLTLQQPLIDLTVFPAYRLGKLSEEAARLQHRFTIRETLFGVTQAYYQVLEQQRLVEVNREALRLAGGQLDLAQKRANVGEVTRSDVLRATVIVETARRTLVESVNTLASQQNILANILNLAAGATFRIAEPPDYSTKRPPFEELLRQAHAQREDLRVQDLAVRQDTERHREIIGEYGPRVVAELDGDVNNQTGTSDSRQHSWQALVSVQLPIFTGGQRELDLKTTRLQIEQTRLNRDKLAKTIEQEVKDAWLSVRSLEETLKALHAQVVAAEQGYHDLENQYRAGTATSVDVLSVLNDLNTARKDLAVQIYTYQVALRNLEQVTGSFQEDRVQKAKVR